MISIKEHEKPELPICKMACDVKLHEKLEKYELTRCAFQKHKTTGIIGLPGSSKSSLVWSWFKSPKVLKKCFTKIFYIAPANSIASMEDNIFANLPDNQIFNELNGAVLEEIIDYCKNSETDEKICIIIDDMASSLKDFEVQKALKHIAMNKRHYHIFQTIIISQTWKSVPMEVRRLYDNIFLFKVGADDLKNIFDETLQAYKHLAMEITKLVFDKKYQYLYISLSDNRLFKCWDELIFSTD
jgi:hypothetical protein